MPKGFVIEMEEYWSTYDGNMKLADILQHFIRSYYPNHQQHIEEFAIEIIGKKLIEKTLDEQKLVELVSEELSKMDIEKIRKTILVSNTKIEDIDKVTIYDVDRLDPFEFEEFVKTLLEHDGYSDVEVTRKSGDQGGDIIATKNEQKFVIQAKRYAIDNKVSNSAVQEANSAIAYYGCDVGAVITNTFFSESAKELAKVNSITLWDRIMMSKLLERYNSAKLES